VLERLWSSGHAGYLVGGTVRDLLLSETGGPSAPAPSAAHRAVDVATDARPERLLELFPEGRYENRFGMVRLPEAEITTFRRDHDYGDHRRPDAVTFTSELGEDLARRDFTINAMAYGGRPAGSTGEGPSPTGRPAADRSTGPAGAIRPALARPAVELVDPANGLRDLEARLVRAVGDPLQRFEEDALRLMRAARFSAQLGFAIEDQTRGAMASKAPLVAHVSRERVGQEVRRMLEAARPSQGFRVLRETGLLELLFPELGAQVGVPQNKLPGHDLWEHTLATLDAAGAIVPPDGDTERRERLLLAALLHDSGKPETFREGRFLGHDEVGARVAAAILERLAIGRREAEPIVRLVRWHMFNAPVSAEEATGTTGEAAAPSWSDAAVRRFIRRVGTDLVQDLFLLREADNVGSGQPARSGSLDELRARVEAELARHVPLGLHDLVIDGDDLQRELGLAAGPEIGQVLNRLLDSVLTDPERNTKERLIEEARSYLAARRGREP
jgi:tRNA nucleotidyltransferase (CCA-adding enzyme)